MRDEDTRVNDGTGTAIATIPNTPTGVVVRQILPVADRSATRAMAKVVALTHPPKTHPDMAWTEWLELATNAIGCHPDAVLRRAAEIALARQKYPNISVNDMVMAVLAAYRDLGVVLSPDARKLTAIVNPPITSL